MLTVSVCILMFAGLVLIVARGCPGDGAYGASAHGANGCNRLFLAQGTESFPAPLRSLTAWLRPCLATAYPPSDWFRYIPPDSLAPATATGAERPAPGS